MKCYSRQNQTLNFVFKPAWNLEVHAWIVEHLIMQASIAKLLNYASLSCETLMQGFLWYIFASFH